MTVARVLILGHSFIRRLREYIGRNADLDVSLHILEGIELKWHGVGGRTVLKTVQFDLSVVELFKPDIVILQLGTNDLSHLPAVNVGSAIEDLTRSLHDLLNVKCVCVCQTIYRTGAPNFNKNVILLNRYLKVVLEPIPYAIFWRHKGFWRAKTNFMARDGVHLNDLSQYKLYRSLRGAVLRCLQSLQQQSGHMQVM